MEVWGLCAVMVPRWRLVELLAASQNEKNFREAKRFPIGAEQILCELFRVY